MAGRDVEAQCFIFAVLHNILQGSTPSYIPQSVCRPLHIGHHRAASPRSSFEIGPPAFQPRGTGWASCGQVAEAVPTSRKLEKLISAGSSAAAKLRAELDISIVPIVPGSIVSPRVVDCRVSHPSGHALGTGMMVMVRFWSRSDT